MALSIGTLVGYLQMDDTAFTRSADNADRKMDALRLHLSALSKVNPKVQVDVTTQVGRLDELKARIEALRARAAEGVDVRVDMVAALVELEAVQAKLREIGAAATKDEEKVGFLSRAVDGLGKVKGPSMLMTALLGLGPVIAPLAGAATLGIGAFGTAALGAVAGIAVLKLALSGLGNSVQAYKAYQKAMAKATTPTQRKTAQQNLSMSAYGTASPAMQAFTRFATNGQLSHAESSLSGAAQASFLPGLTEGIKAALPLTGTLSAAIGHIGSALGDMADKAGHALSSPFWKQFFTWLGSNAATDLKILGSIGGAAITAIARAIEKFGPDGTRLLTWIDGIAKKANQWTAGKGFSKFLGDIRKDASQVAGILEKAAPVVGNFIKGFGQAGPGELSAVSALFGAIGQLPPGVIETLGKYLPYIVLGLKGMQVAGAVASGIRAIANAEKVWAAAQAILNFVTSRFPLVAIIAVAIVAILLIIKYHKQLEEAAVTAWHAIKAAGVAVWHAITGAVKTSYNWIKSGISDAVSFVKSHWALIVGIIGGPLGVVVALVVSHWRQITNAAKTAWNYLVSFGRWIGGVFAGAWNGILGIILAVIGAIEHLASSAEHALSYLNPVSDARSLLSHIPGLSVGTNDAPGGWTWVGENGPELMNLSPHAQVIPSAKAKALAGSSSSGGSSSRQPMYLVLDNGQQFTAYVSSTAQSTITSDRRYTAMVGV